jgi:hypothetical protein
VALGAGLIALTFPALIVLVLAETASPTGVHGYLIAYALIGLGLLLVALITWVVTKSMRRMFVVAAAAVWALVVLGTLLLLRLGGA